MASSILDAALGRKTNDVDSRESFIEFHQSASIRRAFAPLPGGIWTIVLVTPGLLYATGIAASAATGRLDDFLANSFPVVVAVDVFLWLLTLAWLDRRAVEVIVDMRSAFDVTDGIYYSFVGNFVERVYAPIPWAPADRVKGVHPPTAFFFVAGFLAFIGVPHTIDPSNLDALVGVAWTNLPAVMRIYYLVMYAFVLGVGVLSSWIVTVGIVYMGRRIASLPVKLDVTRHVERLGFDEYGGLVLRCSFVTLVAVTVSGFQVSRDANPYLVMGYGFVTLVPVVGLVGTSYGIYRAIKRAKTQQLCTLRETHRDALDDWFLDGDLDRYAPTGYDLHAFVTAKREIERLPEWPVNVNGVAQLLAAVVASNLSLLLRLLYA